MLNIQINVVPVTPPRIDSLQINSHTSQCWALNHSVIWHDIEITYKQFVNIQCFQCYFRFVIYMLSIYLYLKIFAIAEISLLGFFVSINDIESISSLIGKLLFAGEVKRLLTKNSNIRCDKIMVLTMTTVSTLRNQWCIQVGRLLNPNIRRTISIAGTRVVSGVTHMKRNQTPLFK